MVSPPIPPAFQYLAGRPFSFYPPILNIERNEWLYRQATWQEILVVNARTGCEVSVPRRFLGEISRVDAPVLIVGLNRELEYKDGAVWPYQRRVIEMPVAVGCRGVPSPSAAGRRSPAPVVGIRLEPKEKRFVRMIGGALAAGLFFSVGALTISRVGEMRQRNPKFIARDQQYRELSGSDGYTAVVRKLGPPTSDRWQSDSNSNQVRALGYRGRRYTVLLMGRDQASAVYAGTLDDYWRPIHSVELRSGGTTYTLLRSLKRF